MIEERKRLVDRISGETGIPEREVEEIQYDDSHKSRLERFSSNMKDRSWKYILALPIVSGLFYLGASIYQDRYEAAKIKANPIAVQDMDCDGNNDYIVVYLLKTKEGHALYDEKRHSNTGIAFMRGRGEDHKLNNLFRIHPSKLRTLQEPFEGHHMLFDRPVERPFFYYLVSEEYEGKMLRGRIGVPYRDKITVGDFDGDGKLDLKISNPGVEEIYPDYDPIIFSNIMGE